MNIDYLANDLKQGSNIEGEDILIVEDSNQIREESKEEDSNTVFRLEKVNHQAQL